MNLVELGGILVLKLKCSDNLIWLVVLTSGKKKSSVGNMIPNTKSKCSKAPTSD